MPFMAGFFEGLRSLSDRPFYYGERSTTICVVLGPKKLSTYSSGYASGFSRPVASLLVAPPSPRHEWQCRTGSLREKPVMQRTQAGATSKWLPLAKPLQHFLQHLFSGIRTGHHAVTPYLGAYSLPRHGC